MRLTVSCQTAENLTIAVAKDNFLPSTIKNADYFQGTSSLSISADLHGFLAAEVKTGTTRSQHPPKHNS